jgi:hypothetical protein
MIFFIEIFKVLLSFLCPKYVLITHKHKMGDVYYKNELGKNNPIER